MTARADKAIALADLIYVLYKLRLCDRRRVGVAESFNYADRLMIALRRRTHDNSTKS